MNLLKRLGMQIHRYVRDQRGLVTVEWVALCAATCVAGVIIAWSILDHVNGVAVKVGTSLDAIKVD